ncbi:DNA recombination and repair protein Rad51 [Botryosphaeria dothidea]|uniref:DNA recombination and repair protein Rad51 n=1 Tax=Botryosphaeria dothidea TaxID=55169 RepID=A0A8H4J946_9PEZI|nr:DNA recombination and repair protein Rad51 [Botryosphaeria dothidea]
MSDLHHVLPEGFPAQHFSHLLPSLDRHRVTTSDILTLDAVDLAKRAQVPVPELRKLQQAVVSALHAQLGVADSLEKVTSDWHATEWRTISTLDERLDAELGGGIPTGYLTEITGESGAGKTQFLLTLLLSAQLPQPHGGLSKSALYISTEAPLATTRLTQLLDQHPRLAALPAAAKPTLSRILSIQTPDLEYQEHVLRYQLPVAIARHGVGLVVLDSVAANYRAEFDGPSRRGAGRRAGIDAMAARSGMLVQLGALLRAVARTHNVAVVVANQVSDRFEAPAGPPPSSARNPSPNNSQRGPTPGPPSQGGAAPRPSLSPDPLSLDHQQRWFTGWGDARAATTASSSALKNPALGLVWTNQIAARIALLKAPVYNAPSAWVGLAADGREGWRGEEGGTEIKRWRRWMKVVFAPWVGASEPGSKGVEFRILGRGMVTKGADGDGKDGGEVRNEGGVDKDQGKPSLTENRAADEEGASHQPEAEKPLIRDS